MIEDSMEGSNSVFVYSYLTKRKAEFDAEELEESDEELGDEKVKIDDREADKALLEEHEWDMDGSDGLEYHSSTNSDHSSMDLKSNVRKRKAEFEAGEEEVEEEESDEEEEGVDDGRAKIEEEPKARIDYLKAPEWDVDSFDGLEYYSSPEPILSSSDEEFFPEEAIASLNARSSRARDFTVIVSLS
ncbi:PREDICTED: myb-like protein V [Camelina sativa]|uniref:Myb-like protein V n=1 Tax=Camelina sativa TaxID=90675 RepID=A0ABM0TDA4_CAMSA|nr:PREDICTED: myb-like protein V [Camelina sativa]